MYFQRRGERYSFIYYDPSLGKNVRLSQKDTPSITSPEDAEAFCKNWQAKLDSERVRIKKKMEWSENFHSFRGLVEIYSKSRQEEAPNSWQDCVSNLIHYVFGIR